MFEDPSGRTGHERPRLSLPRRRDAFGRRPLRHLQSDGQQLQAHQRARSRPRARPGRPTPSPIPATTAPTWCASPKPGRFEFRLARRRDQSLSRAGRAADGRTSTASPTSAIPASASTSTCIPRATRSRTCQKLPLNLLDALRLFDKSEVARAGFGDDFVDSYVKLKMESWNEFMSHASEWERLHTLDC